MIETEKKCKPSENFLNFLKDNAQNFGECVCKDIYLDFEDFRLMKNDIRLRLRNGKYELKIPVPGEKQADVYEEIEDENQILKKLNLKNFDNLVEKISLVTHRRKFKFGEFNIDADEVTSPGKNFSCRLAEIELMTESADEYEITQQKIFEFMRDHEIKNEVVNGKCVEYIKKYYPELFEFMIRSPRHAKRIKI